ACVFTTTPLTIPNTSAVSSALTINTTPRPVSTAGLRLNRGLGYASWLPISGLALLGLGVGSRNPRRRRWLAGLLVVFALTLLVLQPACGSSSTTAPVGGTPAGTYTVTVSGASGTSTAHTSTIILTVQ